MRAQIGLQRGRRTLCRSGKVSSRPWNQGMNRTQVNSKRQCWQAVRGRPN